MNIVRVAAFVSFAMSFVVLGLKIWAHTVTGSVAILSDALETVVNVIASGAALWLIREASQPRDSEHPYGHGKFEYVSAAFEGGLVILAGLMIFLEATKRFLSPEPIQEMGWGTALIALATTLNLVLGLSLFFIARAKGSEALRASGLHLLSDVWTSVAVFFAVGLTFLTGWRGWDPFVALVIGAWLVFTGCQLLRRSASGLVDEQDQGRLSTLLRSILQVRSPEVIDIHLVKMIRSGDFHHIDGHLVIPQFWSVSKAHEFIDEFEKKLFQVYPANGEVAFHVDPCGQRFCRGCLVSECPLRLHQAEEQLQIDSISLVSAARVSVS